MLKRLFFSLVASCLLGTAVHAADETSLQPFALDFAVSRNDKPLGEARLSLESQAQGNWTFRTHTLGTAGLASLAGVEIDERSEFRWQAGRPETLRYAFDQKMRFKSRRRGITVMPQARRVSAHDDDGEYHLDFESGLIDRNLVVLAIATDLAAGREPLSYRIADKKKIDTQTYRVAGRESLRTARGEVETIRVERVRSQPGRQTTTWFAPSMHYLPVRIRQIEPDGEVLDMQLR